MSFISHGHISKHRLEALRNYLRSGCPVIYQTGLKENVEMLVLKREDDWDRRSNCMNSDVKHCNNITDKRCARVLEINVSANACEALQSNTVDWDENILLFSVGIGLYGNSLLEGIY